MAACVVRGLTAEVASRMSPPRMSNPRRAPAAVPTSTAVGVARPSAQGQAVTSTLQAICALRMRELARVEPAAAAAGPVPAAAATVAPPALTQAAQAAAAAAAAPLVGPRRTWRKDRGIQGRR